MSTVWSRHVVLGSSPLKSNFGFILIFIYVLVPSRSDKLSSTLRMTKPKLDNGRKQEMAPEEITEQHVLELAQHATAATVAESAGEQHIGSSTILPAINNMSKTKNDRFINLEAILASTQASLLSAD